MQNNLPIPKCVFCNKTSVEANMMQMTIYAPGIYIQCYDIRKEGKSKYCKENKDFVKPDGNREDFKKINQ